jgi:asparagine synthase (glutamine-hydrolysing)
MPGICGIIRRARKEECHETIMQMLKKMMHEDWYKCGIYELPDLPICIGWTKHGGEFDDCLPMFNEAKNLILFLNGEVFQRKNIIKELKSKGHKFSDNNGSYLIHLYEELGDKFFVELNGWFCGLLIDLSQKIAFLFNDRFGMNRVFLHEDKDCLYFASEAKSILAVMSGIREFDPLSLGELMTCGCTLGNQSLFKNILIMPPASLWTFIEGKIARKQKYFDKKTWIEQERMNEKQYVHQFIESFGECTKRYTTGLLPVGISLTGGLDTRMVIAAIETNNKYFPCYTFGSMYQKTFDVKVASEVADICNQSFSELVLGEEFLKHFKYWHEKAVYLSDGYIGFSGASELYMNKLARKIAPVRLTGNYGSEVLRGVRAFKYGVPKVDYLNTELRPFVLEAGKNFKRLEAYGQLTFALFSQAPLQGYGRLSIEKSQLQPRTPFMDNDLVKLVYQAPLSFLKSNQVTEAVIRHYNSKLLKITTDLGLLGQGSLLKRSIIRIHREALFKGEYWSGHGMPGWLAALSRERLGGIIEKTFVGRHKFQHFRLWSQRALSNYLSETLIQGVKRFPEYFNIRKVEGMLHEHINGLNNHSNEIDKLLTLILAHQTLISEGRCKGGGPQKLDSVLSSDSDHSWRI